MAWVRSSGSSPKHLSILKTTCLEVISISLLDQCCMGTSPHPLKILPRHSHVPKELRTISVSPRL